MNKTPFAGLIVLDPGEPLSEDDGAFVGVDREVIDRFLELGAKTHRHSGLSGLGNPAATASAGVIASAGALSAELGIAVGYTFEDENGGETMLSPVSNVSTPSPISSPAAMPSATFDSGGGTLAVNTYYYATTFTDGEGGETELGPAVSAQRQPGFASGRVKLSALSFGMAAAGAKGWRLYRSIGGGSYGFLTSGTADTFTDDGSVSPHCDEHPPANENTTHGVATLLVVLPSAAPGVASINLYATTTGDFGGGSLLAQYPVASAGRTVTFPTLELSNSTPPGTNRSTGTAHQIDPDTELLDWHWKRPVAGSAQLGSGTLGDVRLVTGTGQLFGVLGTAASAAPGWTRLGSAGLIASGGVAVQDTGELVFIGSGAAGAAVSSLGSRRAGVTVTVVPFTVTASGQSISNVTRLDFASGSVKSNGPGAALWTPQGPRDWGLVSTLPKGASRGDRCELVANEGLGIVWQMVSLGTGENPWVKIGGPMLFEEVIEETSTSSTSYVTQGSPALTAPFKGDYYIESSCRYWNGTSSAYGYITPKIGAATTEIEDGPKDAGGGGVGMIAYRRKRKNVSAANTVIQAQIKVASGTGFFSSRAITIDPIRLG